jgi:hypothetical protein
MKWIGILLTVIKGMKMVSEQKHNDESSKLPNKESKSFSLRDMIFVGLISVLTPIAAQNGLISEEVASGLLPEATRVEPQQPQSTSDQLLTILELVTKLNSNDVEPEEKEIPQVNSNTNSVSMWLNSPVTQKWTYDIEKDYWTTARDFEDSFKSPPSIRLGLRADGTVVWKKVNNE